MKTDRLYRVEKKDIEKLNSLLTESFAKDPLYLNLIPQAEKRQKLLPELFSCDLDELFENCEIYADSPDLNGIIIVSDETNPKNPKNKNPFNIFNPKKTKINIILNNNTIKTI